MDNDSLQPKQRRLMKNRKKLYEYKKDIGGADVSVQRIFDILGHYSLSRG